MGYSIESHEKFRSNIALYAKVTMRITLSTYTVYSNHVHEKNQRNFSQKLSKGPKRVQMSTANFVHSKWVLIRR